MTTFKKLQTLFRRAEKLHQREQYFRRMAEDMPQAPPKGVNEKIAKAYSLKQRCLNRAYITLRSFEVEMYQSGRVQGFRDCQGRESDRTLAQDKRL